MNCITIWVPPENNSIYRGSFQAYLSCKLCGHSINPGTLISCSFDDLTRLAESGGYKNVYSIHCASCTFKDIFHDDTFRGIMTELVREELKKIIKEEVHDPDGAFSPDGSK